jgi:hypothetical protein
MPTQELMSRAEFDRFIERKKIPICVAPPYDVVPCSCGDVNCHGWRFVAVIGARSGIRDLTYEPVYAGV